MHALSITAIFRTAILCKMSQNTLQDAEQCQSSQCTSALLCVFAHANDFSLLDVETVYKCLKQMSKCKAPGVDNVEVEHLLYPHPIVVVCCLILW